MTTYPKLLLRIAVAGCFLFISPKILNAAIIYVDPAAAGANNGTSWVNAFNNLTAALATAGAGDEIWVKQGVYKPSTQVDVNGSGGVDTREVTFQIADGVALYGGFAGTELTRNERNWQTNLTILSGDIDNNDINGDGNSIAEATGDIVGNNAYHVVYTSNVSAATTVDGFIITAGLAQSAAALTDANQDGGGWYNQLSGGVNASSPSLLNITFQGNYAASEGGAMFNTNAPAGGTILSVIQGCKFLYNESNVAGGAIMFGSFNAGNYQPHFLNCVFTGNEALRRGGAIYFIGDHAILDSCKFNSNRATAISPDGSTLPASGGGVAMTASNAQFSNCNFEENTATGNPTGAFEGGGGGAVYMSSNEPQTNTLGTSSPVFISCGFFTNTASGNTAAWGGAAVHLSDGGKLRPKYVNCVFATNQAQNDGGAVASFTRVLGVADGYTPELKPEFTNCTFFSNHAGHNGGAIYNDGFVFNMAEVLQARIENCILWNNTVSGSGPEIFNTGSNFITHSLIQNSGGSGGGWDVSLGTDGGNNIEDNPDFTASGNPIGPDNIGGTNDDGLQLGNTSPAINAGNNAAAALAGITKDYRGENRILSTTVDMGAYEHAGIIVPDLDIYWLHEWRPYHPPCLFCPWAVLLNDKIFTEFIWDGPAQLIDKGESATIIGRIVHPKNKRIGFDVFIKLINKSNWKEWSAKGRTYTAVSFEAILTALKTHAGWTFWELSSESYFKGTGDISGQLSLAHYPVNNRTGFQLGTGANGWDKDFGLGGSFAYKGELMVKGKKISLSGKGSINVDAELCKSDCTPLQERTGSVERNEIEERRIIVYPVPAHEQITIVPENAGGNYIIRIYNSDGQLKKEQLTGISKGNIVVHINDLKPGFYVLRLISSTGETFSKKIIVQ